MLNIVTMEMQKQQILSGWGIHVNPWLIHVNVWQKPLQYCNQPPTNKNKWKKTIQIGVNCFDGFMALYICQNIKLHIFIMCSISIIPQ